MATACNKQNLTTPWTPWTQHTMHCTMQCFLHQAVLSLLCCAPLFSYLCHLWMWIYDNLWRVAVLYLGQHNLTSTASNCRFSPYKVSKSQWSHPDIMCHGYPRLRWLRWPFLETFTKDNKLPTASSHSCDSPCRCWAVGFRELKKHRQSERVITCHNMS